MKTITYEIRAMKYRMKKTWMLLAAVAFIANIVVSCNDDDFPDNYYTATEVTAAGFLQQNPERFRFVHAYLATFQFPEHAFHIWRVHIVRTYQ